MIFFYKISKFVNSAMDLSDGLATDLERFLNTNNSGISFLTDISNDMFESGEEYEILFSFSPKYRDKILKIAHKFGIKITIFGKICDLNENNKFVNFVKNHHFGD